MNADENEYKINLTSDLLTNFFFEKLDYFKLFVVIFILAFFVPLLLSLHYNTVAEAPHNKDATFMPFIKDYLYQILAILIIAVLLLTKNLFDKVDDVFSSLPKKQIFKNLNNYKKFLENFKKEFNNKYIFLFCLLIIPNLTFALGQIETPTTGNWFDKDLFRLSWIHWFAGIYFSWVGLSLLTWKIFIIVKYIRLLGQFGFNVQIMHPDRCGGFKPIGDLCLMIDMFIFAVGVASASIIYFLGLNNQPQLLLYVLVYICASFFLFFYPIMGIHNAMQNYKTEIMNKISIKLENHLTLYEQTIKDGNIDKKALKKIQDIREINREVAKIPVWPFDSETLWKFASTTSIPVIAVILKVIGVG